MKINELVKDIKSGSYDLEEGWVRLPKDLVVELMWELHKRRKSMSRPKRLERSAT